VSDGFSGHAESVQILFDPQQVSYGQILQVFFSVAHDPTQLNAQGPDRGTQYRSAIFYADDAQKKIAQAYIAQLQKSGAFRSSIVTRVDRRRQQMPIQFNERRRAERRRVNLCINFTDRRRRYVVEQGEGAPVASYPQPVRLEDEA